MKGSKVISSRPGVGAVGGNTKMFGKTHAGPQKSGTSATASKTGSGGKFAKGGGSGKMVGKTGASPAKKC